MCKLSSQEVCNNNKLISLADSLDRVVYQNLVKKGEGIFDSVKILVEQTESESCPFYLKAKLNKGELNEFVRDFAGATEIYHEVIGVALPNSYWEILADAYISLERVHEANGRKYDAKRYLDQAEEIILRENINTLKGIWKVRASSYYRIYEKDYDLAEKLASEAISLGKSYDRLRPQSDGYMLLGIIEKESTKRLEYFKKGKDVFLEGEAYHGVCTMNNSVASVFLEMNILDSAEYYARLTFEYEKKIQERGVTKNFYNYFSLQNAHSILNRVFVLSNMLDSAYYHLEKTAGYASSINYVQRQDLINEIEIKKSIEQEKLKLNLAKEELRRSKLFQSFFIICSIIFLTMIGFLYRAWNRIKVQNQELNENRQELKKVNSNYEVLLTEIHHRVKNNLQNVISLIYLKSENIKSEEGKKALSEISNKIFSIALIHDQLYKEGDYDKVDMASFVNELLTHFKNFTERDITLRPVVKIDDVQFNIETSIPLGILLSELITNSLKYATQPGKDLVIGISIKKMDSTVLFEYRDNGPGYKENPQDTRDRMGLLVINSMARQLRGQVNNYTDNGAVTKITFGEKHVSRL